MQQHHNGESPNTSKRLPVKLIFCEYYLFKEDAERRENYFKTTAGKKGFENYVDWHFGEIIVWDRKGYTLKIKPPIMKPSN